MMSSAKVFGTLFAAAASTSAMTCFSYLVSAYEGKNFKEPELLGEFIIDSFPELDKRNELPAGWSAHYGVGVLWAVIYQYTFRKSKATTSAVNSVLFGIFCGSSAVLAWKLLFKIHPDKPAIDFKNFYRQLFLAHIVFSLTMAKLANKKI